MSELSKKVEEYVSTGIDKRPFVFVLDIIEYDKNTRMCKLAGPHPTGHGSLFLDNKILPDISPGIKFPDIIPGTITAVLNAAGGSYYNANIVSYFPKNLDYDSDKRKKIENTQRTSTKAIPLVKGF